MNIRCRRIVALMLILISGFVASASEAARKPKGVSMLVVPSRYSVIQVAFDIVAHYQVVLVSYQGDASTENPLIHAWNGQEWVYISVSDYVDGRFLQVMPSRTILVGDAALLPPVMDAVSVWCPYVVTIDSIDTSSLVNGLGAFFSFSPRQWEWYAKRYNLTLEDVNAAERRKSWYDQTDYTPKQKARVAAYDEEQIYVEEAVAPAEVMVIDDDMAVPAEVTTVNDVPVVKYSPDNEAAISVKSGTADDPYIEEAEVIEDNPGSSDTEDDRTFGTIIDYPVK